MFNEDPDNIPDSWKAEEEEEENVSESELPPDFENVQPRGYDHDFWDPLIDKNLGGSDIAEVMAGIHVPKTAPHIIQGTSTSDSKFEPKETGVLSFPHVLPNPLYTGTTSDIPSKGPSVQHPYASRDYTSTGYPIIHVHFLELNTCPPRYLLDVYTRTSYPTIHPDNRNCAKCLTLGIFTRHLHLSRLNPPVQPMKRHIRSLNLIC
ncbi:hypothetical protein F2Q70_00025194 [Brassica cretica]|uniref:Uncharacterized protein n=1 Tax=Brassica cretica TaxID=69181 RepID=A0A8S9IG38_BRACR|nr:hypothetical protein F2Q68_00024542 [Brassica cretica]KAF2604663.1 hypothetical protein F2Q70_00025194 [Brassica cretica]